MNPTEPSESVVSLTRDEFEKLPEYSATLPTGVVIGKCWRRKMRANQWIIGEYVASATKEHHAEVRWSRLKILDEAPVSPLAPVGEPRCPVPLAAGERDDILIAFAEACPKPSAAQIIEWCERYPSLAEDIRDHAAIRRDWKAREEIDEAKSLRTAAARPADDAALNDLQIIRIALAEARGWLPRDRSIFVQVGNAMSAGDRLAAALRTASAAQTPVSRETLARLVDALERCHGGSVLLSSTVLAEMDAAKALLASPPQAAAQTGERERALEEAAKVCDMLAAELEADALTCKANPLNIIYPAHEVLKLQQGQASEAASRIRSLASPASGKETP